MNRKPLILLTVCLAVFAINLNTTIVNIALPTLATDLDASTRELLWIVDGYNLAFAALVLAMGSLSDKWGRRPALLVGLVGFGVSSLAGALVDSAGALVVTRFAAGVFAAVIFPTTLSIISNAYSDRRQRAGALGAWGAAVGVGVAAGPVAGGALLEHFSWHSVFWLMVPVAAVALVATVAFVPESRDPDVPPLDRPGLVVSVATLGLLTWTIIEAPDAGWLSTRTVLCFGLTLVLLTVFVRMQATARHPMLDVGLFRDARFSAACAAVTVSYFALFGFIFLITQYFQFLRDYSPLGTGARMLPVATSIAVCSILGGILAPRLGTRLVVTTGMVSLGSAFVWVGFMELDASYWGVVVPQMLLLGSGLGLITTPATESILRVLPPARAGVGSAVNDATRELGGTLGVAVVGSLFSSIYAADLVDGVDGRVPSAELEAAQESVGYADALAQAVPGVNQALERAFMAGLNTSCLMIGGLCLVGAVASWLALPGDRYDPAEDPEPEPATSGAAR